MERHDEEWRRTIEEMYDGWEYDMERDLLSKLRKTYKVPIKTDVFGRREALPSEVHAVINPTTMEEGLKLFPPTPADIKEKDA